MKKYSKLVKKIADEISSFDEDMNKLEKEFDTIKNDNITLIETDKLQTILAYEMWKDGMEWPDVKDLWDGKNPLYINKNQIIHELQEKFSY